ncbi:MAG: hypothetical protein IPI28_18650 [Candidatus Omnitrophica bacterium]|nr:hypothetical protein [Candidatus Omnitrophota bacterium]
MAFGMSLAWYLVVSLYSPFSVRYRFEGEFSDGEGFSVGGSLVFPDAGSEGADLVSPEWRVGDVYFWNSLLVVLHGFSPLFFHHGSSCRWMNVLGV